MTVNPQVLEYVVSVLGPVELAGDLTRTVGRVIAVEDRAGARWVVKTVPSGAFAREVNAYTRWVPRFADQAPRLRHADADLRTLILQHLPGVSDWTFDPADHREAGRLLRRIHESASARRGGPSVGRLTARRLRLSVRRLPTPSPVETEQIEFARSGVTTLREEFGHLPRVPCHGDYGGHNWLRGGGRLRVIDFSAAGYNAAATDFARLYIGPWWERPGLVDAFFEGYGRAISDEELECVRLQLPAFAISLIGHGRRHGGDDGLEIERRGRYRLRKLMMGHDFTRGPRGVRGAYHGVRGLTRSLAVSTAAASTRRGRGARQIGMGPTASSSSGGVRGHETRSR